MMGELLNNSFWLTGTANSRLCGCYPLGSSRYNLIHCSWPSCRCLSFRILMKCRGRRVSDETTRNEFGSGQSDTWRGRVQQTMPKIYIRGWSIRGNCSTYGQNTFESVESDVEDKWTVSGCGTCSPEANIPAWGNGLAEQRPGFEPNHDREFPKNSEVLIPEKKDRVHFLEERDEGTLSRRLLTLSRSNRIRSALELFGSMKYSGLRPNAHSSNSLLSCLLRNGHFDDALGVFEFMRMKRMATEHTYSLVLKGIANSKGCDSALDMFAKWEQDDNLREDIDAVVYNTAIAICGRLNNSFEAERLWRSMKENNIRGTEITYSLLISIFARCGRNEPALDAYDEMIRHGLKPREDAMHAMISACTNEGRWDLALTVFDNMLDDGLKPSLIACNAIINSLGKASETKQAFRVYHITKTLGHEPDEYTWNALLTTLYQAKRYVDVLRLIDLIKIERFTKLNEHMYNTALISCQKLGSWDKALKLLWEMENSGLLVSASSYNLVIGSCEIARKPKVAMQVYERMIHRNCRPDTFTHLSLIRSFIWGSLWDEVNGILKRVPPDASLYNAVIHGLCLRHKTQSAKKLYVKMREIGLKPDGKTRALMLQNLRRGSK